MTPGRLIAVVGPSGVGKDSVMQGLQATMPQIHLVRRVITRPPDQGGEVYDAVTEPEFDALVENGAFAIWWRAHGLSYGIPLSAKYQINKGTDCLANFSRKALGAAAKIFPSVLALNITAEPETLARRLASRGRENEAQIAERLRKADAPLPAGIETLHVSNDGALSDTVRRATALLQPMRVS